MLQQNNVSGDQLRQQIQQTVKEAQAAAEQAAKAAADARTQGHAVTIPPVPPVPTVYVGQGDPLPVRDVPPNAEGVAIAFFVCAAAVIIFLPFVRAIARRLDKSTHAPQQIPADMQRQLQQLSASVDAIAIEVERISEGQRFTTKLLTEKPSQPTTVTPGTLR